MTSAMKIYFATNQLYLGKPVRELPSVITDYLRENNLLKKYEDALKISRTGMSELSTLFLNLFRTPDYALAPAKGEPLPLSEVANIARQSNFNPDTCAHWAFQLVSAIKPSFTKYNYVADSTLYVTPKVDTEGTELAEAIYKAFAVYTWGSDEFTPQRCKCCNDAIEFYNLTTDGKDYTPALFEKLLDSFISASLSPVDIGRCVLTISDLSKLYSATGALVCWTDHMQSQVSMIVPRGKSDTFIAHAIFGRDDFLNLAETNMSYLRNAYIRGNSVSFRGA